MRLDRVAKSGTRSVGDHVFNVVGGNRESAIGIGNQRRLGNSTRGRDAVGPAVIIDPAGPQQRLNGIPVRDGHGLALQHHHRNCFPWHHPIGVLVKGAQASDRRQHPRVAHTDK